MDRSISIGRSAFPLREPAGRTCSPCGMRFQVEIAGAEDVIVTMDADNTHSPCACMIELLLKLHRMGVTFSEVSLVLRYHHKQGPSKMRVAHTVFMTLRLLLRSRWGSV